jgi:hypothetical protein
MPERRLRMVDVRGGSGLGWPCSDDSMGCGHGIARHGWRAGAARVAGSSVRSSRSEVVLTGTSGRQTRIFWRGVRGLRVVVLASLGYKMSTLCDVAARLRAGDVGAAAPDSVVCLVRRWSGVAWAMRLRCLCGFLSGFPHKLSHLYGFWV